MLPVKEFWCIHSPRSNVSRPISLGSVPLNPLTLLHERPVGFRHARIVKKWAKKHTHFRGPKDLTQVLEVPNFRGKWSRKHIVHCVQRSQLRQETQMGADGTRQHVLAHIECLQTAQRPEFGGDRPGQVVSLQLDLGEVTNRIFHRNGTREIIEIQIYGLEKGQSGQFRWQSPRYILSR